MLTGRKEKLERFVEILKYSVGIFLHGTFTPPIV